MTHTDLLPPIAEWTGPNIGLQYQAYANEHGGYSGQSVRLSIPVETATIPHIAYFTNDYLKLAERLEVPVNFDPNRVERVQNIIKFDTEVFALSVQSRMWNQANSPAAVSTKILESMLLKTPSYLPETVDRIAYELMKHSFAGKIRYRYNSLYYTSLYVAFLRKTRNSNSSPSSDYSYEEVSAEIVRNGWT